MSELATLTGPAEHAQEIKKSRFLAQAAPVTNVATAMAFIAAVSDPTATHNCWAYRIGQDYRFNDDGEPSGTAGKPILQAIDGQGLDGVVAVVTRWFGGIKLGAGGLIRAYGGTAAECLRCAEQAPIIPMARVAFSLGYAELELLKARSRDWHLHIEHEDYGAHGVDITASLPEQHRAALQSLVSDLSRGASDVKSAD